MEIKTEEVFHNGDAPFNRIHAAVGVYQNIVYIYGGECASSSRAYSDLWSYRPDLGEWEKHDIVSSGGIRPDDRPGKLIGAKFVAVRTGLYLFGGCIFDSTECSIWFLNTETFQFYKIRTFGSDQPSNLLHASLIWHNHNDEDYLYLFGGFKHLLGPQDSFYRLQIENNRWQKLPSGPSARYKAPMAAYQRHILVVGGITNETEKSDIWGFHLDLNQWLPWVRNIPRQINGFGFVKNDVFYCVGEARKSSYVMIYGYDLVERKLHNFYHKLPENVGFETVSIGRRLIKTKRVRSAPNLTRARNQKIAPAYVNESYRISKEISELTSCGVSLNDVRTQLEDLNSARYDAEKGRITFGTDKQPQTPSSGYKSACASSGHLSPASNYSGPQFDETRFDCGDFSREKTAYRSTRSDVSRITSDDDSSDNMSETHSKTPIQFYSPFSVEPCLLVLGGKPKKPVFKRENLKLFKIDL